MAEIHYKEFLPPKRYKQPDRDEWVRNWKFVDDIDWQKYIPINEEINIHDFINELEDKNIVDIPEEQGGFILNWIGDEEFAEFLSNKYGYKYKEKEIYNPYQYEAEYYILRET